MASRDAARILAFGRIALGVALLFAPRRAASAWVGSAASSPGASVLARAVGVRDAVFGGMLLHTLGDARVARRWAATCGLCDLVDGAAAWSARSSLPAVRGRAGALFAVGAGVAHLVLAQRLADAEPADVVAPVAGADGAGVAGGSDAVSPAAAPREVVYPDGSDKAMRMMGARQIGVDVHHGRGATQGNRSQPGGLQQ